MEPKTPTYTEVVINRNLPGDLDTLTYKEGKISLTPGQTVWVPFRNSKVAALVLSVSKKMPSYKTREVLDPIRENPLLSPWQIKLAEWISSYYFAPMSSIIPMFLPKKIWEGKTIRQPKTKPLKKIRAKLEIVKLTKAQSEIVSAIQKNPKGIFLIHGVTGSGKTEIYLRLVKEEIKKGRQSLLLVPEIALTPQLIDYFQKHFDMPISVIHSKLSEGERQKEWLAIHSNASKIIIGSRSSLFSPFQDLGLIVMDEEHEWNYKQADKTPSYHCREVIKKMNELLGCTVVMGSATPSVETYYAAADSKNKDVTLCEMPERIGHDVRGMPKTTLVDLREEMQKGNFSILSDLLRSKLAETLARGEQAILFINRRGVSPATLCRDCGFVVRCNECRVAMVLHKKIENCL